MYPFCMDYENMLPDSERKLGDWNFVADWRGEDRYDKKRVAKIFGTLLRST